MGSPLRGGKKLGGAIGASAQRDKYSPSRAIARRDDSQGADNNSSLTSRPFLIGRGFFILFDNNIFIC